MPWDAIAANLEGAFLVVVCRQIRGVGYGGDAAVAVACHLLAVLWSLQIGRSNGARLVVRMAQEAVTGPRHAFGVGWRTAIGWRGTPAVPGSITVIAGAARRARA